MYMQILFYSTTMTLFQQIRNVFCHFIILYFHKMSNNIPQASNKDT